MGRSRRPRPTRLAFKLLQIRLDLGLTQQQMLERLDYHQSPVLFQHISAFELDKRDPPLPLLLAYARAAGVTLEMLADDGMDLPEAFAGTAALPQTKRGRPRRRLPSLRGEREAGQATLGDSFQTSKICDSSIGDRTVNLA